MRKTLLIMTLVALLGLIATAALAQPAGQGQGKRLGANLTDEQRTQLQTKMQELRAANATPEQIHAAVAELYKGWGLEMPKRGAGAGAGNPAGVALTDDQWTQLEAKLKELRAANAKTGEIRAAVTELFKGWGVAEPQRGEGQGNAARFGANLTEEQRTQLQDKLKELRAANAKPEEIRAAVAELYKGWGIELPKRGEGQGNAARFGANLTDEQRTQLQDKIKELKDKGAKRDEIKAAVEEMYKGWGLEPPQFGAGEKGEGKGQFGRGVIQEMLQGLTDEQRQQVLTKMDEMKKAGSTPEEIRKTIMEMVKGFGDQA
jgi:Spy/CpxP family protein refolding chaperone